MIISYTSVRSAKAVLAMPADGSAANNWARELAARHLLDAADMFEQFGQHNPTTLVGSYMIGVAWELREIANGGAFTLDK